LKRYKQAKFLDRQAKAADQFQRGEIEMLVTHGRSGGHGLDLYDGGNDIVWFGPTHDLEVYEQINERLSAPDKKHPVNIHHLLAEGTVDPGVIQALSEKSEGQLDLLHRVRQIIEERR